MNKHDKTLVLDSSYMPRSIISSARAFTIHYKGNAEVIYEHPETFGVVDPDLEIKKPSVIRVPKYIHAPYKKAPLTRENIFKRDSYECVYCESKNKKIFTLDHVVPQSKGGPNTWENLVTACYHCNNEKADLTLEEWGREEVKPHRPHYLMLMKNLNYVPEEWEKYLLL